MVVDIIDLSKYIIGLFLFILGIFILFMPLNTILPDILLVGGILESYKYNSIWELAMQRFYYLTIIIIIIGVILYALFEN